MSEQLDALLKGKLVTLAFCAVLTWTGFFEIVHAVARVHLHGARARAAHLRAAGHRRGCLEEQHRVHGLHGVEPRRSCGSGEAVRSFDKEERAKLLQFPRRAPSKVPLNGFKELRGA